VPTLEDSERGKILGPLVAELTPKILFLRSHPERRPVKRHDILVIKKVTSFQKERYLYSLASETEGCVIDQTFEYEGVQVPNQKMKSSIQME